MNVIAFLIVSLIVHAIPLPYHREMLLPRRLIRWLPFRLIWGTGAWALICLVSAATLPWAVLILIMSFIIVMTFFSGFGSGRGFRTREIEEVMAGIRNPIRCIGFLLIILIPIFSGVIVWTSDVTNAEAFDSMITETDEPLFENEIPDNMVRLVTSEYATYLARTAASVFGSNIIISASHITTRNGRLVWVCVVVSTNVLAENYIIGLIIIDANDPQTVEPEVISDVSEVLPGEGLFWDRDIRFKNYLEDMTSAYQYAYPTWDNVGNLVYVQTRTPIGFDFIERARGPIVYAENGSIYSYETIEETPDWITQAYAEEWLERQVSRWGGYRRGAGFDLFAEGFLWFITASNDRLEMSEDTRYIVNPDSGKVEAFIAGHPVSNPDALAGVFRATRTEVYYHDFSGLALISGTAAATNVVTGLGQPASGDYVPAMPLLYPVRINSTYTKWTWYTPVYSVVWSYSDDLEDWTIDAMRLHALGMVDASNKERYVYSLLGGTLSGEALVRDVREKYVALFGGTIEEEPSDTFELTATIVNKTSYVDNGDTHFVLGTDNSTYWYIEGAKDWMALTDWYTLLNIDVGDTFTATIHVIGAQNRIVSFSKV